MKKLSIIFFGLLAQLTVYAQQPQCACNLVSSNDPNKDDYGPAETLFIPNAYPSGQTDNGYTYCLGVSYEKNSPNKIPVIKCKFEYCTPIIAEQVAIVESSKPGTITKIEIEDVNGKVKMVYKGKASTITDVNRVFYASFTRTTAPIRYVSIEAMPGDVPGYNCIDGIALCPTKDPLEIKINLGADIHFVEAAKALGSGVNSINTDVFPVISADGKTLYFDRKDDPQNIADPANPDAKHDDIYISTKGSNGEWSHAVNIGKPLNNAGHNFVNAITPDGNTLLLANTYNADGSPAGAGASTSSRIKGQGWAVPTALNIEGFNNKNAYVSFFMANNNKILLMSIEDNDSYGEKDLYMTFKKPDGTGWVKPINLGPDINTMQAEYSPVLASDNATLYFASEGHYGFGGYDIFMTRRLDNTWRKWSKPINLGPKINSVNSDLSFSIPASGKEVYTYRWNSDNAKHDIFHLDIGEAKSIKPNPVYLVSGTVYNAKTKKPIHADIVYETLPEGEQAGTAGSNPDNGTYKIVLPTGKEYGYFAQAKGYIGIHENLTIPPTSEYTEIHQDLYLTPIEVGQAMALRNVFFEQGKPTLLPSSYSELDRLAYILLTNPTIEIRIDGHTDNQGDAKKNMELSQQRVDVVKAYMVKKGVDAKKITTKAFGGTKPIASNAKEETRKLNRRVEFTITKK
jgi:outer membrane protein OmpA-like peptidoglycan-associated protein